MVKSWHLISKTFNIGKIAEQWLEFGGEKQVSIGDNWVREFVVTYYHIYYDFCKPRCIENDLDWFVMDHLCDPINDD